MEPLVNEITILAMSQTTEQLALLPFMFMYRTSGIGNHNFVTTQTTAKLE